LLTDNGKRLLVKFLTLFQIDRIIAFVQELDDLWVTAHVITATTKVDWCRGGQVVDQIRSPCLVSQGRLVGSSQISHRSVLHEAEFCFDADGIEVVDDRLSLLTLAIGHDVHFKTIGITRFGQ